MKTVRTLLTGTAHAAERYGLSNESEHFDGRLFDLLPAAARKLTRAA